MLSAQGAVCDTHTPPLNNFDWCLPPSWLQCFTLKVKGATQTPKYILGLLGCAPLISSYFHLHTHAQYTLPLIGWIPLVAALFYLHNPCATQTPSLIAIHLHSHFFALSISGIVAKCLFSRGQRQVMTSSRLEEKLHRYIQCVMFDALFLHEKVWGGHDFNMLLD
jgi:hypothetical protein